MPMLGTFVLEIANNPGTSAFALSGAPPGRRGWSGAFPDGEVYYFADDGTQAEWGIGRLTHGTPATLTRETVLGTTQDRATRLNFTGTVQVYSALPAEVFPRPVTQGLIVVPDQSWKAQSCILGSVDLTLTAPVLRAEFNVTLRLNDIAATDTGTQVARAIVAIHTIDAQGVASIQPIAAAGSNVRIDRASWLGVGATTLTHSVAGTTLRLVASVQVPPASNQSALLGMTLQDGALLWLNS
ncbi:hypothetical protein [Swaminathania salitolerans]|uniref:Uncharacterized protein n=1 Tax=Swaminathania salitolerans TaxID=182838 RepID=A0A511BPT4_9PROT|nr:hypothetical protein [Swaminathania salitolerans]GBQ14710.1 hypothetical protein AA21291_1932 [Swaminathania salitolerans LMG 21291]GEL01863.1 hypothetical protein SSA02_10260 [Swaminathania salitolerans]